MEMWPVRSLLRAPENDEIYRTIPWDDPDLQQLARAIDAHGLQDPILVSTDGVIISGHRRQIAAILAGLALVPVRVHPISYKDNWEEFQKLLVAMNSQRIKNVSELAHETLVNLNPIQAHEQIVQAREEKARKRAAATSRLTEIEPDPFEDGSRCEISPAKAPLLAAIGHVLEAHRDYWPLSVRQVHYRLLGPTAPPLHASKPGRYQNDKASYRAALDLCARGRIAGLLPWEAIDDLTRPVDLNTAFRGPGEFLHEQLEDFLVGYWRNLQQSQPTHIEILAEKLTVQSILSEVAQPTLCP